MAAGDFAELLKAPPREVAGLASLPTEALCALALKGTGDARIVALESLPGRADFDDEAFRSVFLAPPVWRNADEHVRWLAVKAIGARTPEAYAEPLLEALADASWLVREHAVLASTRALAQLREAGKVELGTAVTRWQGDALRRTLVFVRAPAADVRRAAEDALSAWVSLDFERTVPIFFERVGEATSVQARSILMGVVRGLRSVLTGISSEGKTPFESPAFLWFERALKLGSTLGDACLTHTLAGAVRDVSRMKVATLPESLVDATFRFLSDPNPLIAAAVEKALDEPAVLSVLLRHPRVRAAFPSSRELGGVDRGEFRDVHGNVPLGFGRASQPVPDVALARIVKAAARMRWGADGFASDVLGLWELAADCAFECAGARDFRVRRAARALLAALGPRLASSLVAFTASEHSIVAHDIPLALRLRTLAPRSGTTDSSSSPSEPWAFRQACREAGTLGGAQCTEFLESLLTRETEPQRAAPATAALTSVRQRLYALRSCLVVLWNQPERDAEAGAPVRNTLALLAQHPVDYVREAALHGR